MSADSGDFHPGFDGNSNDGASPDQIHSSQYKHHNINLKQINQQNAHSMERPQHTGQANVVQLKGKISKQTSNAVKAAPNQKHLGNAGGQYSYGAQQALEDQQTYQMTRSQEPPVNRSGKNQLKGHKN